MSVKVITMRTPRGNVATNQFTIKVDDSFYFQSYNTIIAKILLGHKVYLSKDWNCSRTTTRYLCQFLGLPDKKSIERNIDTGFYELVEEVE